MGGKALNNYAAQGIGIMSNINFSFIRWPPCRLVPRGWLATLFLSFFLDLLCKHKRRRIICNWLALQLVLSLQEEGKKPF